MFLWLLESIIFLPWNCLLWAARYYTFEVKTKRKGVVETYLDAHNIKNTQVHATTSDGYTLTMQKLGVDGGQPVFFLHGMFESSAMPLAHGLESLPIKLAQDGYW